MKEYLMIAEGSHGPWQKMTPEQDLKLESDFGLWVSSLKEKNLWVRGDALTELRRDLVKNGRELKILDGPFSETKEVFTGFFIFRGENMNHALELAKGCPSLLHDNLELYEMMGER